MSYKQLTALVTSGPTRERIDPVRYISNFSSGKQGHAVAEALRDAGYEVTLISGPVNLPDPAGIKVIHVETAEEMLQSSVAALPVDVAVFVAAVCDFRPEAIAVNKIKKRDNIQAPVIKLVQNPDILKIVSHHKLRPKIVIGFAAETENLLENARSKLNTKGCDVVIANDVSGDNIFGSNTSSVKIITQSMVEEYFGISKIEVAKKIIDLISNLLEYTDI